MIDWLQPYCKECRGLVNLWDTFIIVIHTVILLFKNTRSRQIIFLRQIGSQSPIQLIDNSSSFWYVNMSFIVMTMSPTVILVQLNFNTNNEKCRVSLFHFHIVISYLFSHWSKTHLHESLEVNRSSKVYGRV